MLVLLHFKSKNSQLHFNWHRIIFLILRKCSFSLLSFFQITRLFQETNVISFMTSNLVFYIFCIWSRKNLSWLLISIRDIIHMTLVSCNVNPMKSVLYFTSPMFNERSKTHVKSISKLVKWNLWLWKTSHTEVHNSSMA